MDFCAWAPMKSEQLSLRCCLISGSSGRAMWPRSVHFRVAEGATKPHVSIPERTELDQIATAVPPMIGAEYLTADVLANLWRRMDAAFDAELAEATLSVQEFLKRRHPVWNLVGRVHFNLAENRKDEEAPFAFLATYTTRLSAAAKAQHLPLGKALEEYAGAKNREGLLSLLMPVQRAGENCSWLKTMIDAGEIFHPLRWSPQQALRFLKDVPALESAGVVVRMPASWHMHRPARPQVKATIGDNAPSRLGLDALLNLRMEVTLDGESLSAANHLVNRGWANAEVLLHVGFGRGSAV
jgi:SNF2 Helicase protein